MKGYVLHKVAYSYNNLKESVRKAYKSTEASSIPATVKTPSQETKKRLIEK